METAQAFAAEIVEGRSGAVVVLPFNPNDTWGPRRAHHVTGSIGGCIWRGAVDHDGTRFFIALGPAWRRDNGLNIGATVDVNLAPEGPQLSNVAADIAAALAADPDARAFFEALPTFYRKNDIRWIDAAKRPATRAARIAQMVERLRAGERRG